MYQLRETTGYPYTWKVVALTHFLPIFGIKMASISGLVTCQTTLSSYSWKLTLFRIGLQR